MLTRFIWALEICFFIAFWWQTRINLSHWWPEWFSSPLNSDYLIPFVYLSDIFLIALLSIWVIQKALMLKASDLKKILPVTSHQSLVPIIKNPATWLGLFLILTLISVNLNGGAWWSWYSWWRLVQGVLLSWYIFERWQDIKSRNLALGILIIGLVFQSIIMVGEWTIQKSLGLQWIGEWSFSLYTPGLAKVVLNGQEYLRAYGTFAHPNIAASALAMGILIAIWWALQHLTHKNIQLSDFGEIRKWIATKTNSKKTEIIWNSSYLTLVGLLFIGLFVTFSRSAWLVAIAGVGLLLVWRGQHLQNFIFSNQIAKWVVLVCMVLSIVISPMVWSRFDSLDGVDRLSVDRRVQLNQVATDLIEKNYLWGVGLNNFIPHLAGYGPLYGIGIWREPAHNLLLLIAAEAGTAALVTWLVAHSLVYIKLATRLRRNSESKDVLFVILWLAVILLGLIDHYWWTSQQGRLMWWLLFGASLAWSNMQTNQIGNNAGKKSSINGQT